MKRFLFFLAAALALRGAEINPAKVIAVLKLKDGTVLEQVQIVSCAQTTLMAKWDGGRGTLRYEDFPDDWQAAFASLKPAAPPPPHIAARGEKRRITGQLFVAAKGGENFKLGAVTVGIYPKSSFEPEFKKNERKATEAMTKHWPQVEDYTAKQFFELAKLEIGRAMRDRFLEWIKFKPAEFSGTTDADGRFSIEHNLTEPFVIFAAAQRLAGDKTEYYLWRVGSEEVSTGGEVLLSNKNQFEPR